MNVMLGLFVVVVGILMRMKDFVFVEILLRKYYVIFIYFWVLIYGFGWYCGVYFIGSYCIGYICFFVKGINIIK